MVITIVNLSLEPTDPNRLIEINMHTPDSISEIPSSPSYSPHDIKGRSSQPAEYDGGGARTISFSIELHRDMVLDGPTSLASVDPTDGKEPISDEKVQSDKFEHLLNKLRALNYPVYTSTGVVPPRVYVKIGDSLRLKGYVNVTFNYERPMKFNRLMKVTASFDFTEVVDISWSAPEIIGGMNRYVIWHDKGLR